MVGGENQEGAAVWSVKFENASFINAESVSL